MNLQLRLQTHKLFINDTIQELLAEFLLETQYLPRAEEAQKKLADFLIGGKMIRGCLICLTYQMITGSDTVPKDVYKLAAAEEIFASALLIHDDVMDRDRMRRGKLSIFAQYENDVLNLTDQAEHYGYSQALLLGDICFFWVQNIISKLSFDAEVRIQLQSILATESIRTGFGQMLDVDAAMLKLELTQQDIESISLNKTARYTFVLPFLLGATAANAQNDTNLLLEKLGNAMGVLFQIKDDELGLFGTEQETGKPEGNDVKEGKQTLFYYFTKNLLKGTDLELFKSLYGTAVNSQQLTTVRNVVESSGAFDEVQTILSEYAQTSRTLINELPISKDDKQQLLDFLEYNLQRKR